MKKTSLLFLLMLLSAIAVMAQGTSTKVVYKYIFSEFIPGKIVFRSGKVVEVPLNYNTLTEEMVYPQNGQLMAIDNATMIDTIYIQGRKFIHEKEGFYEVVNTPSVLLLIKHKNTLLAPPKPVGYGGTSETSATNSYSSITAAGGSFNLEVPEGTRLSNQTKFYIKKKDELYRINSLRQAIDAFPKKKSIIKEHVKANKTDFSKAQDIIKLLDVL